MTTMTATEARAALPEVLDRVLAGDEVTITRHGQPVAVVVRPDALRVRRAEEALGRAAQVRDILRQGRASRPGAAGALSAERAEELIATVRSSRRAR
jgi:prevent-host-death family protein